MTEKVAQAVKSVSVKAAEAACRASLNLGMADAFAIGGLALIGLSFWFRSRIKKKDHLPCA